MAESTERSSLWRADRRGSEGRSWMRPPRCSCRRATEARASTRSLRWPGVSKQTVYKHFDDKERLFTEIVLGTIDQVGEPFYEAILLLQETDDLVGDLRELARRLVMIVMQPRLLQLRRLVIGEAARFPELGRAYFERGPGQTIDTLASGFEHLANRGLLRIDDASIAASRFLWLAVSIPLNEVMLCGEDDRFSESELESFADEGLRVFLAAYGTAG